MKDIREVLVQKQTQCAELTAQIDALIVASKLLREDQTEKQFNDAAKVYVDVGKLEAERPQVDYQTMICGPAKQVVPASPAEPKHAVEIQKQHISDLRVLIDKSEARENVLLDLVKMVMEEKFFHPTITGPRSDNRTTPAIPPEHLSDVEAFDEKADQEQSEAEGQLQKEMQEDLNELLTEHKEAHQEG